MGQAAGVATDAQDHVWVVQRPRTLTDDEKAASFNPPRTKCCVPAPPVLEFDQQGNLVQAWGGPGQGYDWPQNEHGIYIDPKGFVWLAANGDNDGQILKFTRDGKFVLQIGKQGPQTNSLDTSRLGRPASVTVDAEANEVYVADGYYNHRIIVFDADTGAFKRQWGAYGKPPTDEKLPPYNPARQEPARAVRSGSARSL
jgi:DNA-binding beta-propeller fold protein YncE